MKRGTTWSRAVDEARRTAIRAALNAEQGNVAAASRALGLSRTALVRQIKILGGVDSLIPPTLTPAACLLPVAWAVRVAPGHAVWCEAVWTAADARELVRSSFTLMLSVDEGRARSCVVAMNQARRVLPLRPTEPVRAEEGTDARPDRRLPWKCDRAMLRSDVEIV